MKILSLFDGMACGYEALQRAGIPIDKYYASEIDKYAIQIATKNHPDIIEIGDVKNVRGGEYLGIDLLIGGSPCQGFSVAGKQLNFEDPRSKLFFEYVRILKESKPKYFLLENVSMRREWIEIINRELGVEGVEINSNILSAQSRRRIYRTNIPDIFLPENPLYTLKDILLNEVEDKYRLNEQQVEKMRYLKGYKAIPRIKNGYEYIYREGAMSFPDRLDRSSRTILTSEGTISRTTHVIGDDKGYRKLTPIECERLQTLPDNYTGYYNKDIQVKNIKSLLTNKRIEGLNVVLNDATENQNGNECVLCIREDLTNTEAQNYQLNHPIGMQNVNIVIEKLERSDEVLDECVIDTTKTDLGIEIHYILTRLKRKDEKQCHTDIIERLIEEQNTSSLWRIKFEGIGINENVSIILTLLKRIILLKIFTYVKIGLSITIFINSWRELQQNCIRSELLLSRIESIDLMSDSQRYKMLGNGRTVDVIKHIFSFIPKTDED